MRMRTIVLVAMVAAVTAIYTGNTSLFSSRTPGVPVILAHRGLPQDFERGGLTGETCTAERMRPPRHNFLENTIPSIEAAFEFGAQIVEIDVHPTTDGHLAVFHDWTVDCRTEGSGRTRDHSFPELQALDIGYGYTADGGETFPFRGQGIGLVPSLTEVLERFPDRRFLIDIKSNEVEDGERLVALLKDLPEAARARLAVHGGERPVDFVVSAFPGMKSIHRQALVRCLSTYAATGWTGIVPQACHDRLVLVPLNVAPWMWGWPDRFLDRMEEAGSEVFLLAPFRRGQGFSEGIDEPALLERLPSGYSGGIWTDAVDLIAPAVIPSRASISGVAGD
jgi:glycerophosphoryl diester phosphodiesterase